MTVTVAETTNTAVPREGRMLVQIMTPGIGSSGVYPAPVVEAAATARVFPAGTHMYADHPSVSEDRDRPERSIKDLAGVLTQDAYWDGTALVAEAKTYEPWSTVLSQMHDAIGVSIRASARVEESDDQGRPIIAELVEGLSVDFVTHAGRGGRVMQVYESARRQVQETLPGGLVAGDLERRLDDAVGPEQWVIDFTDEWVVYRTPTGGGYRLARQTYIADDTGRITLTGTPQGVARRVTYDATELPSTPAGITQENTNTKESPMGTIQIDEAEHTRLKDQAGRVETLESERDAAIERATTAETQVTEAHKAADAATIDRLIAGAEITFTALEAKGLTVDLPVGENGRLDVAAFEKRVAEAAAIKAEANGDGRPNGVGVTESTTYTEADLDAALGITKGA